MKTRFGMTLLLAVGLAGCPEGGDQTVRENDRDTLTRRQRDSITATMPLPGARGVGNAMNAADAASANAAAHDSLLAEINR